MGVSRAAGVGGGGSSEVLSAGVLHSEVGGSWGRPSRYVPNTLPHSHEPLRSDPSKWLLKIPETSEVISVLSLQHPFSL